MRAAWAFAIIVLAMGSAAAAPERDMGLGAAIAATCASCHRLDGHDIGIPAIVGLGADRIASMLRAFRADAESHHLMHTVSATLSDAEVDAVARYLATLGREAKAP